MGKKSILSSRFFLSFFNYCNNNRLEHVICINKNVCVSEMDANSSSNVLRCRGKACKRHLTWKKNVGFLHSWTRLERTMTY